MEDKTVIKAVAIICLTILASIALATNIHSATFMPIAVVIGIITGCKLRDVKTHYIKT